MRGAALTDAEKVRWRADEERWWGRHGGQMTFQWEMTPELHRAVRGRMDCDRDSYLLRPGESLLDLGCGRGAMALRFAASGMKVLGIDLSFEQVNAATARARAAGVAARFHCADAAAWDATPYAGRFDNAFVNAFLHHLPPGDLDIVLEKLALVLKPGGRLYFYEPLWSPGSRRFWPKAADYGIGRVLDLLINRLPARLGWISMRHQEALAQGYTPLSPREAAVDIDALRALCQGPFEIVEIRPWHLHSIGFAMQVMTLSEGVRRLYVPWASLWYWIDQALFALADWREFAGPQRFVLCSLKLVRRA